MDAVTSRHISMKYEKSETKTLICYDDKCDKYDYLLAAGCGAIAGVIDVFLVGAPGDSKLQVWTDKMVDTAVMTFAKICGWKGQGIASAIKYLEEGTPASWRRGFGGFKINYDQRHSKDVGDRFNMSMGNHHMKSLAHSPDAIGLFFSILNQFTNTSSFLSNGELITIATDTFELQGHDFVSKAFCGAINWLGHLMSDVAGSSKARGDGNRGSGIVIPFYELFNMCVFGSFAVNNERKTLAAVATKAFENGYDSRFGITMSIPVTICDLLIRSLWMIKHIYYHKYSLKESIPSLLHDDLRTMLIIGDGTLCLIDGVDSVIKSKGDALRFLMRLNIIAWYRLIKIVLKDVYLKYGIDFGVERSLNSYVRINEALSFSLDALRKIDVKKFEEEIRKYDSLVGALDDADSEDLLYEILSSECENSVELFPWGNDFESFIHNRSIPWVYK